MKNILVLLFVLLLSSCTGTGKNIVLLQQELQSDETQIFVKRETGWSGSAALIKVELNGNLIGELGEKERLNASTKIGSGIVKASFTMIASIGAKDALRTFKISKGEKLFFIIKQDIGVLSTALKIYQIDQNDFFEN